MMLDIYNRIKTEIPDHHLFVPLFIRLYQFIILERRGTTTILDDAKKEVDTINNYLFKHDGRNVTLMTVYQQVMTYLSVPEIGLFMDTLMMISYFRTHLSILVKRIVYSILLDRKYIMENKTTHYSKKIPFSEFINKLKEAHFKGMVTICMELYKIINKRIIKLYG